MATSGKKEKKGNLVEKAKNKPVSHKLRKCRPHFNQFKPPEFEKTQKKTTFNAHVPVATASAKALVPATGLYSPEWIKSITANTGPLFEKLSLDLRLKIWELAVDNIGDSRSNPGEIGIIEPFKCGNKFRDEKGVINAPKKYQGMARLGKKLNALYLLCKQAYLEIHGSGLFYARKHFRFSSAVRMMGYLSFIHPISRNAIKTMELQFWIRSENIYRFDTHLTFPTINSMESLQTLHLFFLIQHTSQVSDKLVDYLENNKGLKNLKGIRNFRFEWGIPMYGDCAPKDVKIAVENILKEYVDSNKLKWSANL